MRRSMREQLVSDLGDGDQEQRKTVCSYDRMRGLAYAPDLSRAIKRVQVEAKSAEISMCVATLDKALIQWSPKAKALNPEDRHRLCLIAVLQRVFPLCDDCGGRATIYDHGKLVIQCETCGGSGKRKFTHQDWRRVFGRALAPEHEIALDEASAVYSHHDSLGERIAEAMVYGDEA